MRIRFPRLDSLVLGIVFLVGAGACAQPTPPIPTPEPTNSPAVSAAPSAAPKPSVAAAPAAAPAASPIAVVSPSPSPAAASASVVTSPVAFAAGAIAAPRPTGVSFMFTAPTGGQTVSAGSVTVTVSYTGPALVSVANATKLDDYHLHYFLDVDATPYIGTLIPIPTGDPRIIHSAALSVTFDNVAAGNHMVAVVLTGSNHISVNPPVADLETFMTR
jgi:hypothetical protein